MSNPNYQYILCDGEEEQYKKENVVDGYKLVYGGRENRPPPEKPAQTIEKHLYQSESSSYPKKADHPVGKKVSIVFQI
jgi:hypothetical protein